jgi:hypothetical protein
LNVPAPEVRSLNDDAVLWAISSTDGYGRFKVSSPIEIRVRWEDSRQESADPQNMVEARPAQAFVDRVIDIGSVLWHGRLKDLPAVPTELYKVSGYNETPDIKNRFVQRAVTLVRRGDAPPEIS